MVRSCVASDRGQHQQHEQQSQQKVRAHVPDAAEEDEQDAADRREERAGQTRVTWRPRRDDGGAIVCSGLLARPELSLAPHDAGVWPEHGEGEPDGVAGRRASGTAVLTSGVEGDEQNGDEAEDEKREDEAADLHGCGGTSETREERRLKQRFQ